MGPRAGRGPEDEPAPCGQRAHESQAGTPRAPAAPRGNPGLCRGRRPWVGAPSHQQDRRREAPQTAPPPGAPTPEDGTARAHAYLPALVKRAHVGEPSARAEPGGHDDSGAVGGEHLGARDGQGRPAARCPRGPCPPAGHVRVGTDAHAASHRDQRNGPDVKSADARDGVLEGRQPGSDRRNRRDGSVRGRNGGVDRKTQTHGPPGRSARAERAPARPRDVRPSESSCGAAHPDPTACPVTKPHTKGPCENTETL